MNINFYPLKIIENPKGNVLHALKKSDKNFENFGDSFFLKLIFRKLKLGNILNEMKMNFFVPYWKN